MRTFLAVLSLTSALLAQNTAAPERFADARAKIVAEIENGHAPSLAVAVLEGGEVVWAEGFGLADVAGKRPATADSIYRLASISKPFTATAIMQLVERQLIDLDAPVNRYLDVKLRAYQGTADQITVRRLLNHNGGLGTHWNFFYGDEAAPSRADSIRDFGFAVYEPGTRTNYSNFAFGVLDHVVARLGKNTYRNWLVEELLDPLGMTHTDVGVRPGQETHAAVGYTRDDDGWKAVTDYGFDHDGASAVRSSANDLMRFARLQLGVGTVDGVRVLDKASALAMRERRGKGAFGIGWSTGEIRGVPALRHSGGMPGVSTQLAVFPEHESAVVVLNNCSSRGPTNRVLNAVLDVILGPEPPQMGMEPAPQRPVRMPSGRYRGLIQHPNGAIPVSLAVPDGDPLELRIGSAKEPIGGDARRVHNGVAANTEPMAFDVGHGGPQPAGLRFALDDHDDGFRGVVYATVDGVCRLPFWCELQREEPKPRGTLRVVTYNILVGFRDSSIGRFLPGCQREAKIAAFLAAQQPDIVALQEMNGFTEARLRRLAASWFHDHVALLKEDGYPVAITSSAPLSNITRLRKDLHHGMLRVTTHDTDFVVVHFRPHAGVDYKLAECEQALELYREALAAGRQAIVLGDYNSIHPTDGASFSAVARTRYEQWGYFVQDDRPAEVAMTPLLEAGAVDVFLAAGKPPAQWPLPRIDFVLASPGLADRATTCRWLCDELHLRWSDHPPVVADFAVNANRK